MKFNNHSFRKAVIEWNYNQQEAESEYGHISTWDTSEVTDMRFLFRGYSEFNDDISNWNLSQVTDMHEMFWGAAAFNQNIGKWDVSQVTDMRDMFKNAFAFNQNIGQWDVSQVTDMCSMFYGAKAFNQNIGKWNVSKVRDMTVMFYGATTFNQDIGQWPIRRYIDTGYMFDHSGMSAKTFKGIYGNRIADKFDLEDPDQDAVMEPYTRWERRKNAVTLMSDLNNNIDILNSKEEKLRNIFDLSSTGRNIVLFI